MAALMEPSNGSDLWELRSLRRLRDQVEATMLDVAGELFDGGTSPTQIAFALGVSRAHLYRLAKAGQLRHWGTPDDGGASDS